MSERLATEIATFDKRRGELLARHAGRYALIHRDEVAGVFDEANDAFLAGHVRFASAPFLVRKIASVKCPGVAATHFI